MNWLSLLGLLCVLLGYVVAAGAWLGRRDRRSSVDYASGADA